VHIHLAALLPNRSDTVVLSLLCIQSGSHRDSNPGQEESSVCRKYRNTASSVEDGQKTPGGTDVHGSGALFGVARPCSVYTCLQNDSHNSEHAHSSGVDNRSPNARKISAPVPPQSSAARGMDRRNRFRSVEGSNPRFLCLLCSRTNNYGAVCVCGVMIIVLQAAVEGTATSQVQLRTDSTPRPVLVYMGAGRCSALRDPVRFRRPCTPGRNRDHYLANVITKCPVVLK
jgi:hypothetical protein